MHTRIGTPMARAHWMIRNTFALLTVFAPVSAAASVSQGVGEEDEDTHGEDDAMPVEDQPVSLRPTRGAKHPDCGGRTPMWEHVVTAGEHLGAVAGRYGIRQRDVLALNPQLRNPDLIRPGERLRVCPEIAPRITTLETHTVAAGETLSEIAEARGMSMQEFLAAQERPIVDPHRLRVGQVLRFRVDGGVAEAFLPPRPEAKRTRGPTAAPQARTRARVDVQLDLGDAAYIKRPHLAFGTAQTVRLLKNVVHAYKARHRNGPRVLIGDISRRGGGQLTSHRSHRTGKDVDVGYVLRGAAAQSTRFAGVDASNLDLAKTWTLIDAFLDTHEVVYIFMDYRIQELLYEYALEHGTSRQELDEVFQYPRGRGRNHGIIRHWKSHKHHFHVRFR